MTDDDLASVLASLAADDAAADAERRAWWDHYQAELRADLELVEASDAARERERLARLAVLYPDVPRATAHVNRSEPSP